MTALPQISRFIDSNITEGDFKVALSELRDYLNGLLGEDGTPATAGKKLNLPMSGVLEKTQDCTATSADKGKVFRFTGTSAMTLSLDAAMALGDGWNITVINDSSADLVIDPYAGETIDGNETLTLGAGLRTGIVCDGTRMMTTYRQEEPTIPGHGMQVFYDSGIFVVPSGVTSVKVRLCGGGGGGGWEYSGGGSGGTTSFGSFISATGGAGGSNASYGAANGSGIGASIGTNIGAGIELFGCGVGGVTDSIKTGGNGGYAEDCVSVIPSEQITVTVGAAGNAGWFNNHITTPGTKGICIVEW